MRTLSPNPPNNSICRYQHSARSTEENLPDTPESSNSQVMNTIVKRSFDSLETSLESLVESVSSYNPSPPAAIAVVNADDTLTESLEQLDEHQQNYQRILSLRATSETLNKQLTELLETLSEARKEVLNVAMTKFPQSNEVPYNELLTYARKISKYTRPPQSSRYTQPASVDHTSRSVDNPNSSMNNNSNGDTGHADSQATRTLPLGLSEEDVTALDPSSQMPFTPWPSEEVMKRGALSHMGYEEELRAKGLPIPDFFSNPAVNGQAASTNVEPPRDAPTRVETVAVQSQHHERPKETQPPPGLSLSLDLYDPDED
ncbi:vitamin-D-receptor interacting mediator subunit 4-domain-containing protein [Morchella snyderi]|nr:vitamin-D-receptor interacting mediator subunit 4-domain-containing protein [Morchella snyderi]